MPKYIITAIVQARSKKEAERSIAKALKESVDNYCSLTVSTSKRQPIDEATEREIAGNFGMVTSLLNR